MEGVSSRKHTGTDELIDTFEYTERGFIISSENFRKELMMSI